MNLLLQFPMGPQIFQLAFVAWDLGMKRVRVRVNGDER